MKQYIFLFIFACALFVVAKPQQVFAATYAVTKFEDTADGTCNSDCSLREAVIAANSAVGPDTITLLAGQYTFADMSGTDTGEDIGEKGDLDFTDSDTTTLIGAGVDLTTIDANVLDRAIHVAANASADISELTIQNGSLTGDSAHGGGIFIEGDLVMSNAIVTGNTLTGASSGLSLGAGISCKGSGSSVTLDAVSVTQNVSGDTTKFVYGGGMSVWLDCSATVSQSTFSENEAYFGAGLYITTSNTTSNTYTDLTVTSNTASPNAGGGIVVGANGTTDNTAVFNNVLIYQNSAVAGGGGMYVTGPVDMTNAAISDNDTDANGGGVLVANSINADLSLAFSTITKNVANDDRTSGGNGGGIITSGVNSDVQLRGTILAENSMYDNSPATTSTDNDCYATTGITSQDYNYVATTSSCDGFGAQEHDNTTSGSGSVFFTAMPEDNGGNIQTVGLWTTETKDQVPEAECLNASGDPLTTDARGLPRPELGNCDMGQFESDQTDPTVLITNGTDTIECVTGSWIDAGATATDNFASGLTASYSSGSVDVNTVGTYPIVYNSTQDEDGNIGTNTRMVTVEDTEIPTITVVGDSTVTHEAGTEYTDPGATATDVCDDAVSVNATALDVDALGGQTIHYTAADDSENSAEEATRTVTVEDTIAPTLTLQGETEVTITEGDEYTDAGATARDSFEGDITENIYAEGVVDTATPGTYTIVYSVADSSGNQALEVSRTVVVEAAPIVSVRGKFVELTLNGEIIDRIQISKKPLKKKEYTVRTQSIYDSYTTVAVLIAKKQKAKLIVLRLTKEHTLKKKVVQSFSIKGYKKNTLQIQIKGKRITNTIGTAGHYIQKVFKLRKNGQLEKY